MTDVTKEYVAFAGHAFEVLPEDRKRADDLRNLEMLSAEQLRNAYRDLAALYFAMDREGAKLVESLKGSTANIQSLFLQDLLISAGDLADSFLFTDRVDQDGRKVNLVWCNKCRQMALGDAELVHAKDCLAGRVSKLIAAIEGPDVIAEQGVQSATGHLNPQPNEQHIAYEVEEHPWASEEGNCPNLGRRQIVTHEEAAAERRGVLR